MRRARHEAGSVAVETAVVAPALVLFLLLVAYAGQVSHLEASVQRAASEASRAATLRAAVVDAEQAAIDAATANLEGAGCDGISVEVDTSEFRPGGSVTVAVRCDADMSNVAALGVQRRRTLLAWSTEVIDLYRAGPRP